MKSRNYIYLVLWSILGLVATTSCEQEGFEPLLTTEEGAGTLTTFKAYTLEAQLAGPDSVYGRVVFWESLNGTTLVQLSVYNMPEGIVYPSSIMDGTLLDASSTSLISLYDIEDTGEGYNFGEFATAKYFVIDDADFYSGLDGYDAHVVVTAADGSLVCGGDIGANTTPVEEN